MTPSATEIHSARAAKTDRMKMYGKPQQVDTL